jgi:beta-lactamase regulating signal transducer with metallopeptidase domain
METMSSYFLTFFLNALWQIPAIAGVAWVVCRVMRHGPAAHRHVVWVMALAASLLLPVASVRSGAPDSGSLRSAVPAPGRIVMASPVTVEPVAVVPWSVPGSRTISYAPAIGAVLLGAYLLFLLIRCGRLLWIWTQTERIRQEAGSSGAPPLVEKVWLRCLTAFGQYDVELLSSPTVQSPVTAGAWRKAIILPESLLSEASEDVLVTAIGHEMAHVARRDFALRVVYEVLWLPIAFHPAMLLIRRGIEQTREMACDELVTRKLLDAGVYARSILAIAAAMSGLTRPGYTLGVFDGDILEQRIRRLVERPAANLKRARLLLATGLGALALCAAIVSGLAISARAQDGPAMSTIRSGIASLNRGDVKGAVELFQNAVRLEPSNTRPKLYLANALLRQWTGVSGDTFLLDDARRQYQDVLALDPQNRQATEGMASVALFTRQFSEAHDWVLKAIAQDPKNESAYYSIGFIDWSTVYPAYSQARAAAGMKMEAQGIIPDAAARKSLRDQYGPQLEEGFRMLQIALQLDPADSDAMAYLNLLYRLKSGMTDSEAESRTLVAKADGWVDKALAAKRLRAQHPKTSLPLDAAGDPPGPGDGQSMLAPPPPPPPPPPPGFAANMNQPASSLPMRARNVNEVPGMYWQVAGDRSATALVGSLKQQGFHFRIADGSDGLVRVVVGPYNDALSLAQGKAALIASGITVVREW